jgi:hypothetical protein
VAEDQQDHRGDAGQRGEDRLEHEAAYQRRGGSAGERGRRHDRRDGEEQAAVDVAVAQVGQPGRERTARHLDDRDARHRHDVERG